MSKAGDVVFDRSAGNQEDIWDDTELIKAYDHAHRQIQNRLKNNARSKKRKANPTEIQIPTDPIDSKIEKITTTTQPNQILAPIPISQLTPPKNEEDALNSMLMAWYMAGYHAGQMAAKAQQNKT